MVFTSLTYILFFAIVCALYWSFNGRRHPQNLLLLTASYIFYLTWDSRFGALLLATSLLDYGVGLSLGRAQRTVVRRALLLVSIIGNVGTLAFFKYFNFFSENFRLLAQSLGWRTDPVLLWLLLPVGISFYTFKSLSYTIDIYLRRVQATPNVIAYLTYVAFFPQLLAGPIDRASNLLRQMLAERRFSYPMAVDGCRQMLWGFFKKMVVADNLTPIVNVAYTQAATRPGPHLALATVFFAFHIYCDFSAYSDIAIGSAKLLGFESVKNFAYPYFSQSPAEFWRRWHISLTTWFRDYVYFSLEDLRGSKLRRALNVMITFLLSGLWHGASWNFIVWGGINGAAITAAMFWRRRRSSPQTDGRDRLLPAPGALLKILLTFAFTCCAFVFFRAPTLADAVLILKKIFADALNFQAYRSSTSLLHPYADYPLKPKSIIILLVAFVCVEWLQRHHNHPLTLDGWPRAARWFAYTVLIYLILYFGTYFVTQFYYFQF